MEKISNKKAIEKHIYSVNTSQILKPKFYCTKMSKKQYQILENSIKKYGLIAPIVVRSLRDSKFEIIDGVNRFNIMQSFGRDEIKIHDIGSLTEEEALYFRMILNNGSGTPGVSSLHVAITKLMSGYVNELDRVRQWIRYTDCLPFGKDLDKVLSRLAGKASASNSSKRSSNARSWISFRFNVDPSAALVCDNALSDIERKHGVKRNVAFEYVCADYLSGASVSKKG